MLVELQTIENYAGYLAASDLEVTRSEVLNMNCEDLGLWPRHY
jgi:hypothetical protein